MRMIKVGDQYLGLVSDQKDAMRFSSDGAQTRTIAESVGAGGQIGAPRSVRLKARTSDVAPIDPPVMPHNQD